jgi:hypothetical protein
MLPRRNINFRMRHWTPSTVFCTCKINLLRQLSSKKQKQTSVRFTVQDSPTVFYCKYSGTNENTVRLFCFMSFILFLFYFIFSVIFQCSWRKNCKHSISENLKYLAIKLLLYSKVNGIYVKALHTTVCCKSTAYDSVL